MTWILTGLTTGSYYQSYAAVCGQVTQPPTLTALGADAPRSVAQGSATP